MHDLNKNVFPILKRKIIIGQPIVLVSEEFGFRDWFWLPKKSVSELEKWWKRQPYMGPSRYIHVDSIGEMINCSTDIRYLLWNKLKKINHPCVLNAYMFHDTDTWLEIKNRVIYHSGYHYAKLQEEDNIAEYNYPSESIPLKFYSES